MIAILGWVLIVAVSIATLALAVYGLHLYVLLFLFRRRVTGKRRTQREVIERYGAGRTDDAWPLVTTQIPIYNERDVATRVIEAAAAMDYPPGRHEVQVLDDSDDATRDEVDAIAATLNALGHDVKVVRREARTGYKAGALAYGLETARGAYVAVFDADFVPPPDFLRKAVPLIDSDSGLACIQGRWDHLNRSESWLTEAQAYGIDAHFAIEQGARAWNALMMNFNGTAGMWRKAAIDDPAVGGWSGDTLTEDLDLSYRAQLAGWRIDYCMDLPCPAELPGTIGALKSQQRRWATGSTQVACKLLPQIWRSGHSLGAKIEATLHLTHYSVAVWMLVLAIVVRPLLAVFTDATLFVYWFRYAWVVIVVSAIAPSLVYAYARLVLEGRMSGLRAIPSMLVLGCGICANNAAAVIRGLYLRGGEFVRTPKSGSTGRASKSSSYQVMQNRMWFFELALGIYSFLSFTAYFLNYHKGFSLILLLYAIGFLLVGWSSRPRPAGGSPRRQAPEPFLGADVRAAEPVGSACP